MAIPSSHISTIAIRVIKPVQIIEYYYSASPAHSQSLDSPPRIASHDSALDNTYEQGKAGFVWEACYEIGDGWATCGDHPAMETPENNRDTMRKTGKGVVRKIRKKGRRQFSKKPRKATGSLLDVTILQASAKKSNISCKKVQKNAPKKMATKPEPPTEKEVAAALLEFRNNAMVSTKHSTSIRVLTTRIGKKTIKNVAT